MPVTRSASRLASTASKPSTPLNAKRRATGTPTSAPRSKKPRGTTANISAPHIPLPHSNGGDKASDTLIPAVLTFSFDDAKKHLIGVDERFEDIFNKMKCRPYEHLERVHPFRALATSIIGQQISWMAARSINHRFVRLYDPSIPENYSDYPKSAQTFFPSPEQVSKTDLAALKSVGLSGRKAEYVQDLATRFADGRLSTEKLIEADDEELANMLIEVRGIGKWTIDMFSIFSLRRPNILPIGDLGVQRGVILWFLSLHSSNHSFTISPEKITHAGAEADDPPAPQSQVDDEDVLPNFGSGANTKKHGNRSVSQHISSVPPAADVGNIDGTELPSMPEPFTPSINKTLNKVGKKTSPLPLPDDLSISVLKSRLDGKKIKGAMLTPKEMEDLTDSWKPYRSLGVYYMWSLAKAR